MMLLSLIVENLHAVQALPIEVLLRHHVSLRVCDSDRIDLGLHEIILTEFTLLNLLILDLLHLILFKAILKLSLSLIVTL